MGSMYGFWRTLNKEERAAKQRYLQMFYNLQYRNLVSSRSAVYLQYINTMQPRAGLIK